MNPCFMELIVAAIAKTDHVSRFLITTAIIREMMSVPCPLPTNTGPPATLQGFFSDAIPMRGSEVFFVWHFPQRHCRQ